MGPLTGSERRGRRAPMAEINVTPMVDVMLVLLIIFMVTAPLLVAGVPIDLPDTKAGALDQEVKPVQISIESSGAIFVDDRPVAAEALSPLLAQIAGGARDEGGPRIFLRADRSLDYGRVMQLMGEINAAGLRKVALVSVSGDRK
ncbi:biopolymer transporter ExbD [Sphingosinicella sp. GR2756]|uniref:Biopolymer transporter ExbD n=2 Tax=Sphingosinicella rhizophila TaxID=3050082 RepID=A0ABU3QBZ1_9SPHN|nr:biopolymer transporter ExbD [Sphingosinicella sp. GR2756]MDT9600920.1 biopolymer transporter ExbD [Sphingosinicella sp. GR2756]